MAIDEKFTRQGYGWTPRSGSFEGEAQKQLESMLQTFAEDFASCIFGMPASLQSLGVPEDFKRFLCMADKKFLEKLIEQDSRAARGEKAYHALSKKNIDQLRAYFLNHLLITRFIQPLLITPGRTSTVVSRTFLKLEMREMNKAALNLFKDFQKHSFESFPDKLKDALVKKSAEELAQEELEKAKTRFSKIKTRSPQRHMRSASDTVIKSNADPLRDKALLAHQKTIQRKQIDEHLDRILAELGMSHFPFSLSQKIIAVRGGWFAINEKISDHAVMNHLIHIVRDLIIEKKMDAELVFFEEKLSALNSKSIESRAKHRATMPVNLDDLDFLNAIVNMTIPIPDDKEAHGTALVNTLASVTSNAKSQVTPITTTTTNTTATTTTTTTTTLQELSESDSASDLDLDLDNHFIENSSGLPDEKIADKGITNHAVNE